MPVDQSIGMPPDVNVRFQMQNFMLSGMNRCRCNRFRFRRWGGCSRLTHLLGDNVDFVRLYIFVRHLRVK
jgi:hypothetical protein